MSGNYTHDSGRIIGTVSGSTMRGEWSEAPSYSGFWDAGKFEFVISDDCNTITGNWGYGASSTDGGWTGTRVIPEPPQDEAVIYCKVRDSGTKAPVSNAVVTLTDISGDSSVSTQTDAGGNCAFENLKKVNYQLTVFADGYSSQSKLKEAVTTQTVEPVIFELTKWGVIKGTVVDKKTNSPVKNLEMQLLRSNKIISTFLTDKNGSYGFYDLSHGEYSVSVSPNYPLADIPETKGPYTLSEGEVVVVDFEVDSVGTDFVISIPFENASIVLTKAISTYTATVTNLGPEKGHARVTIDTNTQSLASIDLVNTRKGECRITGSDKAICELDELARGEKAEITVGLKTKKAGEFSQNLKVEASAGFSDPDPRDNSVDLNLTIKPYTIRGRVHTTDRFNTDLPIKNIPVRVMLFKNGKEIFWESVFTNERGEYSYDSNDLIDEFQLEAWLMDKDRTLALYSDWGYINEDIIKLKTEKLAADNQNARRNIHFHPNYLYFDASMTAVASAPRILRDAAVYYANIYEAVLFARNTLQLNLDHKLPVEIYLYRDGCAACYLKSDSRIQGNARGTNSDFRSRNSPDNREYHEFGHHVNADSSMGGENTYPNMGSGDTNHGGVENSDSSDSVIEGFAEFFSISIANDPVYNWAGGATNLQWNLHFTKDKKGKTIPDEEFMVASLLWDLADADNESGDNIALGFEGVWRRLNSEKITTVRSLYLDLKKWGVGSWDMDKNGMTDLDDLFIRHWMFHNTDDDTLFDRGEDEPGYGVFNPNDPTEARDDRERIPGTALEFSVKDRSGNELPLSFFEVFIDYPGDYYDFTYNDLPDPDDGYLWAYVPVDAEKIEILPIVPGYKGEPLVMDPDTFWDAVVAAKEKNESVYATQDFVLQENRIPQPPDFVASAVNGTFIRLTWAPAGQVVLVAGIDHYPTHTSDGRLVYEGPASKYGDEGLLSDTTYYYTLFSVEGDELSKGATASATTRPYFEEGATEPATGEDGPSDDGSGPGLIFLVLFVVVLALVFYIKRRKD